MLAGRVEQGLRKPGEEVIFLPTYTSSNPGFGKVSTAEMQRAEQATPGDYKRLEELKAEFDPLKELKKKVAADKSDASIA